MEILGTIFVGVSFVILVIIYSSFSWGFVAYKFYGWFILSSFTDLPIFTITQFVGFLLFVGIFTHKESSHIKDEYKDKSSVYTSLILGPWIVLFIGWVIHSMFF